MGEDLLARLQLRVNMSLLPFRCGFCFTHRRTELKVLFLLEGLGVPRSKLGEHCSSLCNTQILLEMAPPL